jgi:uncharacterized membrane protein
MKPRYAILLLLWAAVILQRVHYFPQLPHILATHFDFAGRPNGWSSKESFFSFYVSMTVLLTALFFFGLPFLLRVLPASLINLPHREYWLVPARKEQAIAMVMQDMGIFGNAVLAMVIASIQLAINANLPGSSGFQSDRMWALLTVFSLFTVFWLVHLYRRFAIPH